MVNAVMLNSSLLSSSLPEPQPSPTSLDLLAVACSHIRVGHPVSDSRSLTSGDVATSPPHKRRSVVSDPSASIPDIAGISDGISGGMPLQLALLSDLKAQQQGPRYKYSLKIVQQPQRARNDVQVHSSVVQALFTSKRKLKLTRRLSAHS
eukprot:jgi/Hompol1/6664/HPOL_001288-RA